jgi:PhzF family phenazine biosynthesis protein
MKIKIYHIDAFTDRLFHGNPAGVCPLDNWLPDDLMQQIAMENNRPETAFYVQQGDEYQIRWFTPKVEVDLCGHATLAAAYSLFHYEGFQGDTIRFVSPRSGKLPVRKQGELLTMNFPVDHCQPVADFDDLCYGFVPGPKEVLKGKTDYVMVFKTEDQIRKIKPDLDSISRLNARGVIVTAKGDEVDFVSRFFAPQSGIDEDPVTGSAHTTLTPYWAKRLGKNELTALQLSERQGRLSCKLLNDRVEISGQCRLYSTGEIHL